MLWAVLLANRRVACGVHARLRHTETWKQGLEFERCMEWADVVIIMHAWKKVRAAFVWVGET